MDVRAWLQLLWLALAAGALAMPRSSVLQALATTGKVRAAVGVAQLPGAALLQLEVGHVVAIFIVLQVGMEDLTLPDGWPRSPRPPGRSSTSWARP